jgi:hypothetical protein
MKIPATALALMLLFCQCSSKKDKLPSYPEVVNEFMDKYNFQADEPTHMLKFAKKKDGWYTQVIDFAKNSRVVDEQLFWALEDKTYRQLGFEQNESLRDKDQGPTSREQRRAEEFISNTSWEVYNFARCRYYGYPGWDDELIRDFGKSMPEDDTLIEGVARAYSSYSQRYMWGLNGIEAPSTDPLQKKLEPFEIPDQKRIDQFLQTTNKAIEHYRALDKRSPGYKTIVGTPAMEISNEQFFQYNQLMIAGKLKEAKALAKAADKNDTYSQIGHYYLRNCPQNSILITFGDNDTYPLWYVQEKENFRTDVTVLNYSLLGAGIYVNALRQNNTVAFTTDLKSFGNTSFNYFTYSNYNSFGSSTQDIATFISDIQSGKLIDNRMGDGKSVATYSARTVTLDVDTLRFKQVSDLNGLNPTINFTLNSYMILNDLIVLDLINSNFYTRPICFTAPMRELIPQTSMLQEGSIYRLVPTDYHQSASKKKAEIAKMEAFVGKDYKPVMLEYEDDDTYYEDALIGQHATLFANLIENYISIGERTKATNVAKKYLEMPDTKKMTPGLADMKMVKLLFQVDFIKEGKEMMEIIAERVTNDYKHGAATAFNTASSYREWLGSLKEELRRYDESSDVINELLEDAGVKERKREEKKSSSFKEFD